VVVVTRTNFNQRGMHQQTQALLEVYILPGWIAKRRADELGPAVDRAMDHYGIDEAAGGLYRRAPVSKHQWRG
jgi:hypothetical protein